MNQLGRWSVGLVAVTVGIASCGGSNFGVEGRRASADEAGADSGGAGEPAIDDRNSGGEGGGSGREASGACTPNQPVCDGDRATTCNADGSGYVDGGTACASNQVCSHGTCEDQECRPSARFCSGTSVRECDASGLSSQEVTTCGSDEYCDVESAKCTLGLCAPDEPTCDGQRATLCNAEGDGYLKRGTVCKSTEICEAGECHEQLCVPNATFCDGQAVKTCSANGLSSKLEETCDQQTCVEAGDSASCEGSCAPGEQECADGAHIRACAADGELGAATACAAATPYCSSNTCNAEPASCDGLAANCGPSANESCCKSPLVSGGTFDRDNDSSYPATVASFRLDKYEVTVGRFRKFVSAVLSGWKPAAGAGKHTHLNGGKGLANSGASGNEAGWDTAWNSYLPTTKAAWDGANNLACDSTYQTWTPSSGSNELRPVNCVNWYQALAFCTWDQGFLPSEAEWSYASVGGNQQRVYPWSSPASSTTIDCSYANYFGAAEGSDYCVLPGTGSTSIVGSYSSKGDGRFGQADLAGNLEEWTLDWFATFATSCINCAYLKTASARLPRGGAFLNYDWVLAYRVGQKPDLPRYENGIRCARLP